MNRCQECGPTVRQVTQRQQHSQTCGSYTVSGDGSGGNGGGGPAGGGGSIVLLLAVVAVLAYLSFR